MNQTFPLTRNKNIVIQNVKKEVLLYDLETDKAYCLNHTSAFIWQNCDGRKSVGEIVELLNKEFKLRTDEDFVLLALDQFRRNDLLDKNTNTEINFDRLHRREVIRKVGLTSLIALPIISSIVAPNAVMAQSGGFPTGVACSADAQCFSGNCSNFSPSVCCAGPSEAQPGTVVGCVSFLNGCESVRGNCCSGSASSSSVFSVLCLGNPLGSCVCS